MREYLIIDGYNIINSWADMFNLNILSMEEARKKLLDMLSDYQGYSGCRLVVVFDAYKVKDGLGSLGIYDNIKVIFTKENQTADNFIERYVKNYGAGKVIRVATGDYLEQKTILQKGGFRMTPAELKAEVNKSKRSILHSRNRGAEQNFLENQLTGEQRSIFEDLRRRRD
jgi:predicted RNA-binding protein with PIN domain